MQQAVGITVRLGLLLALLLVIVDIDAQEDALLHHCRHHVAVELAKELAGGVHVLANHNVSIVVNDHTVHVVIRADGQASVALFEKF